MRELVAGTRPSRGQTLLATLAPLTTPAATEASTTRLVASHLFDLDGLADLAASLNPEHGSQTRPDARPMGGQIALDFLYFMRKNTDVKV